MKSQKRSYIRIHSYKKPAAVMITLFAASFAMLIASWKSTAFADWFTDHIFPLWTFLYGHLTSLVPFSVGEWMLLAAVLWVLLLAVFAVLLVFLHRRRGYRRFFGHYLYATAWICAIFVPIMIMNCFMEYHCTSLETTLPGYGKEYTMEDLSSLRDMVVTKCNDMAEEMPRDGEGNVVFEGGESAMQEEAEESVSALQDTYPRLGGYQVTPKPLYFSVFVSQQYMQGYYFPFSMEANYNELMEIMNKPFTMCHELSHTHGYIYEDDANFLAFLACTRSDNIVFQYSGWLGILNYVDNAFYDNAGKTEYWQHVEISSQVFDDNEFLSEETWDLVGRKSSLDTETVKTATDTYLDTTLKVNGVSSGKISYSHVVALLLEYFDGSYS